MNWTKPYFGVQHCGQMADYRWATVEDWNSWAKLIKWAKGTPLNETKEEIFDNAEIARYHGEIWIDKGI